jgi:hypothetical protein
MEGPSMTIGDGLPQSSQGKVGLETGLTVFQH